VTVVRRDTRRRWLVVLAAALVLVALPVAVSALPARAPSTGLAQLAARVRASAVQPFQGYAVSSGSAGLPALPQLGDVADLLNGDTHLRVWYESASHWRVDVIDVGAERDTYQTPGRQVVWDFGRNLLTEVDGTAPVRLPQGADLTPPDLARRSLSAAGDDVTVSALPVRRVAGIDAAGLRVTPRSPLTTVGHIDVWADPRTGLPLEVAVTGRGAREPFLATRFLEVNQTAPAGSVLVPPAFHGAMGYTVADSADVTGALTTLGVGPLPLQLAGQPRAVRGTPALLGIGTYGTGLAQFLVLPVPRRAGFDAIRRITRANGTPLTYPTGRGVQISTPLLSVLALHSDLTEQTYLMVGLVEPKLLRQAAVDLVAYPGGP
jgi:hypothetical protein